jgi:hypothetical protein
LAWKNNSISTKDTAATVGCEAQLWQMADALRGSMDAASTNHVTRQFPIVTKFTQIIRQFALRITYQ